MEVAHDLFGRLQWSELFEPVVQMCREGFNMTNHTGECSQAYLPRLLLFASGGNAWEILERDLDGV